MRTQDDSALGGGRHVFSLIRRPYAYTLLDELSRGKSRSLSEITHNHQDSVARSTMAELVDELDAYGALQRRPRGGAGRTLDLVLTGYGRGLRQISTRLRGWLAGSAQHQQPAGAGEEQAVRTIASHAEGSAGAILRRLCRAPTMRSTLIKELLVDSDAASCGLATVDQVDSRIRLMRKAGLIEVVDRISGGNLYAPTELAGGLAGPLAHATALELCYRPPSSRPPLACEVELILSLAGPRLPLPQELDTAAAIELLAYDGTAEIAYRIESGGAAEQAPDSDCRPTAEVTVATEDLFGPLLGGQVPKSTGVEGDLELASTLLQALSSTLGVPAKFR